MKKAKSRTHIMCLAFFVLFNLGGYLDYTTAQQTSHSHIDA